MHGWPCPVCCVSNRVSFQISCTISYRYTVHSCPGELARATSRRGRGPPTGGGGRPHWGTVDDGGTSTLRSTACTLGRSVLDPTLWLREWLLSAVPVVGSCGQWQPGRAIRTTRPRAMLRGAVSHPRTVRPLYCQCAVNLPRFRRCSSRAEDPHRVLGVARGCSNAELKQAFREAAKRWHPDMQGGGGGGEAERMFKRVRRSVPASRQSR